MTVAYSVFSSASTYMTHERSHLAHLLHEQLSVFFLSHSVSLCLPLTRVPTQMPLNCTRGKRRKRVQNNLIMSFPQSTACRCSRFIVLFVPKYCSELGECFLFYYSSVRFNLQWDVLLIYRIWTPLICCTGSRILFMHCSCFTCILGGFTFLRINSFLWQYSFPFKLISYSIC